MSQISLQSGPKIPLAVVANMLGTTFLSPHLQLCKPLVASIASGQTVFLQEPKFRGSTTRGGVLLGIFGGGVHLQIQTQFQTKKCHFPYLFSDLAPKIHTRFQT